MSEPITVTVTIDLKPEQADGFFNELLPQLQKQTIAFAGVRSAQALRQVAEPTKVMFIDEFESTEAADAYFAWRAENGDLEKLNELLAAPPRIEVWPLKRTAIG